MIGVPGLNGAGKSTSLRSRRGKARTSSVSVPRPRHQHRVPRTGTEARSDQDRARQCRGRGCGDQGVAEIQGLVIMRVRRPLLDETDDALREPGRRRPPHGRHDARPGLDRARRLLSPDRRPQREAARRQRGGAQTRGARVPRPQRRHRVSPIPTPIRPSSANTASVNSVTEPPHWAAT
jgi:ATPase subunit of ABC transporter with duplicated ATPase domains